MSKQTKILYHVKIFGLNTILFQKFFTYMYNRHKQIDQDLIVRSHDLYIPSPVTGDDIYKTGDDIYVKIL